MRTLVSFQIAVVVAVTAFGSSAVAATNNVRDRGELSGPRLTQGIAGPYYRIIVRVQGPRNTVSLTESLIHF